MYYIKIFVKNFLDYKFFRSKSISFNFFLDHAVVYITTFMLKDHYHC